MMFLQFFTWSSWFATLGLCLGKNGLSDAIGGAYQSAPVAAIVAPLFLGLIADRFFSSQIVMAVLLLLGGGILISIPGFAKSGSSETIEWLCLGHMLRFMPTLGLSNTIVFSNIPDQNNFPRIRVWGTIGWIVAGLIVGFLGWSAKFDIFQLAGGCSLLLGLYSFTLPHTPPPGRGKPIDLSALLMLDALALLRRIPFLVFMICSTLICIPLAYYYAYTSAFLGQLGFSEPASTMTIGQMSEIFFMLLIPFFFRRMGVKWMIVMGMAAWALRYLLFALGAAHQQSSLVLVAVILHGICYDFFFVTGFMYTDREAPADMRGQAQSMLVFFTQGVGMFFGYWIADTQFGNTVRSHDALNKSLHSVSAATSQSFTESLSQVFLVSQPEGVDTKLLAETMDQWQVFWMLPAAMSVLILTLFTLLFRDREIRIELSEVSA
ncbi:Putative nucleoside transporter YegT [Bythopirellula goksoeyrii]|uniref:Nucleoside transporter YegT n=2 Tax=Bythopirellula goksoeyrii TaxID=1400387 RepID=A0A5B9QB49_9BACT|nr:Putative nucleoside transporter YegT [Bythopirellula goksoeyrii]